jgi:hypothetical protein
VSREEVGYLGRREENGPLVKLSGKEWVVMEIEDSE